MHSNIDYLLLHRYILSIFTLVNQKIFQLPHDDNFDFEGEHGELYLDYEPPSILF